MGEIILQTVWWCVTGSLSEKKLTERSLAAKKRKEKHAVTPVSRLCFKIKRSDPAVKVRE